MCVKIGMKLQNVLKLVMQITLKLPNIVLLTDLIIIK